jgi:hypothetical protein
MTRLCQNGTCTREGTIPCELLSMTVRPIVLCQVCFEAMSTIGVGLRRTDGVCAFVPVWRRRQQQAKDYTGSVA